MSNVMLLAFFLRFHHCSALFSTHYRFLYMEQCVCVGTKGCKENKRFGSFSVQLFFNDSLYSSLLNIGNF